MLKKILALSSATALIVACGETTDNTTNTTDNNTQTTTNSAPVASFTQIQTSIEQGQSITFTSTSSDSDGTIASYQWSIGGNAVVGATASTFTHQFDTAGSFLVSLAVTDNGSASSLTPASQLISVTTSNQTGFEDFSLITTQDGMRVYEISNCGDEPADIANSSQSFSSYGQFWGHINATSANESRWANLAKGYQAYGQPVTLNDANCNDVSVYNTTLVKRYADWDNQHANGYHISANQFNYSDVDYIVFEIYFDATESTLPSVTEIGNNFPSAVSLSGGQISSIEDWDEGKFQLNLQLNSGDGFNGTNYNLAEINIQLQPEWANKWLRLEIPIDQMHHFDSVSYSKNTKTAASNTSFNRISFVAETKAYSVYRNWAGDNFSAVPEMFKEMNYSVKRLELIGK